MNNSSKSKNLGGPKSRNLMLGKVDDQTISRFNSFNSEIELSAKKEIQKFRPFISVIIDEATKGTQEISIVDFLPLVVEKAQKLQVRCQLPTAYKAYNLLVEQGLFIAITNTKSHKLNKDVNDLSKICENITSPQKKEGRPLKNTIQISNESSSIANMKTHRVVHLSKNNTSLISTLMSILPNAQTEFQEGVINISSKSNDIAYRTIPYKLRTYTDSQLVSVMLREDAEVYIAVINVCYQAMTDEIKKGTDPNNVSSITEFHIDSVARFLHPHTKGIRTEHRNRIKDAMERIRNTALDLEELLSIDASDITRFSQTIDKETSTYLEKNKDNGMDVIQSSSVRFEPFAQCQKKVVMTKKGGVIKTHESSMIYQVQLGKQIERDLTSNENEWLYIIPPSLLSLTRHHGLLFDIYMECRYRYNRLQPESEFSICFMNAIFPNDIIADSKSERDAIYLQGKNKFRTTLNQIRKQSKQTQERNNISSELIKNHHFKLNLCGYECRVNFTDDTIVVKPNQEAILKATNTTRKSPTITNALAGKSLRQHKLESDGILKLVDNIHFDRNGFVTTVRFSGTETKFTVVPDSALRDEISGKISGAFDVSLSVASRFLAENDYGDTITYQGDEIPRNDINNAYSKYKVLAKNMKMTEPLETFIDLLESEDNDAHELILNLIG